MKRWDRLLIRLSVAFCVEMVGIGTSAVNMEKFKYSFGSLLGHDEESWGLSYTGQSPARDPETAKKKLSEE